MFDPHTNPDPFTLPFIGQFNELHQEYYNHFTNNVPLSETTIPVEDILGILREESTILVWEKNTLSSYRPVGPVNILKMSSNTGGLRDVACHIMACWCAAGQVGYQPLAKPIKIKLNNVDSRDPQNSNPIQILLDYIGSPKAYVELNNVGQMDPDYKRHAYLSETFGLKKFTSPEDKLKYIPWSVGSIVTVFSKKGSLSESAPWGAIESQYLGEVTKISAEELAIYIRPLNVQGTLEDSLTDYMKMSAEARHQFRDLLKIQKPSKPRKYLLQDIGMNLRMSSEPYLVTGLSTSLDQIDSYVMTSSGRIERIRMNELETIHWCLKQRKLGFNEDLFFEENPEITRESAPWYQVGEYLSKEFLNIVRSASDEELDEFCENMGLPRRVPDEELDYSELDDEEWD